MALTDITLMYSELLKLRQSPLITLVTLDLTPIGGPGVYRFVEAADKTGDRISFGGVLYTPLPIKISGFGLRSSGQQVRPTLTMSNFPLYLRQIILLYRDLVGAKVSLIQVFEKHLDGRPNANPQFYFGPDVFFINKKLSEDRAVSEFELVTSLDLENVKIPVRTVQSSACRFVFRGDGCLFAPEHVTQDELGKNIGGFTGRFRGDWASTNSYEAGEGTRYYAGGYWKTYKAKNNVAINGSNPVSDTANWQEVQRLRGQYDADTVYSKNDVVWIRSSRLSYTDWFSETQHDVRHYFIRNTGSSATGILPPHKGYWTQDVCVKTATACSKHHDPQQANDPLPFGAFPGTVRLPDV